MPESNRNAQERLRCPYCGFSCALQPVMARHLDLIHAASSNDAIDAIRYFGNAIRDAGEAARDAGDAIRTFRREYLGEGENESQQEPPPEVRQGMPPTRARAQCRTCAAVFYGPNRERALQEHMSRHTPPQGGSGVSSRMFIITCPHCREEFNVTGLNDAERNRIVAEHTRRRHGPPRGENESNVRQEQIVRADLRSLDVIRRERDRLLEEVRCLSDLEVRRRMYEINPIRVVGVDEAGREIDPRVLEALRGSLHIAEASPSGSKTDVKPPLCANCGKDHDDECKLPPPEDRPRKIVL